MFTGLWFDVGIKGYTTTSTYKALWKKLWFDVGIKGYTTSWGLNEMFRRCGLM